MSATHLHKNAIIESTANDLFSRVHWKPSNYDISFYAPIKCF